MQNIKQNIYLQIVNDVKRKIELGLLTEGEKLASCREYAITLGINPNTVQRAYATLESDGYIYTVPKKGVYVSAIDKKEYLDKIAKEKIKELKAAGINRAQLNDIINEVYDND